jgi:signal transduction histidine kinase/ligand-binding sensor domain-containing protein
MLRLLWLTLACLSLWSRPALALDPDRRLSQYAHSAWRIQDGSFGGAPSAVTQTSDGYVWIGTSTGLVRFDGVRFVPWTPGDGNQWFSSNSVWSLLGGRDGSLWIGTGSNLARLKNGRLFNYTSGRGRINAIVEDQRGGVWITRTRVRDDAGPLCQVTGDELRCYGKADGIALPTGGPLMVDADGTFWVGNASALVHWSGDSSRTHMTRQLQPAAGLSGVAALAAGPDGSVWSGMSRTGPGLGLQRLQEGVWRPVSAPDFDGSSLAVNALFMDRGKAMWIGTEGHGIYRLAAGRMDRFSRADGLSGDSVTSFHEDREGNMWVATSEGIDCFRDTRMVSYSTLEGLSANQVASVLAARDGTIWAGNSGALEAIRGHHASSIKPQQGLPGISVTALLEDHAGRLWLGVDNGVAVYEQGRFRRITRRDGTGPGPFVAMIEDRAHNIWGITVGTPRRLVRIEDFNIREEILADRSSTAQPSALAAPSAPALAMPPDPQLPAAGSLAADPEDGIWLGLGSGSLARYRQGRLETFRFPTGTGSSATGQGAGAGAGAGVRQVVVTSDGAVLGARMDGLIAWHDGGTQRTLTVQNGLPCGGVYAFAFDTQGALWLYTQCGLLNIAETELRKWWKRGDTVVKVNVFDALDGVRPGLASFQPRVSRSPDGRLWFANETVVQMIDPAHQTVNAIPPPVHIEQVIADRKSYPVTPVVQLPPLTGDLEIDYVGLSFVAPQKVRFRYRLEGRDQTWQEPGTRRQAFYNDLRPGTYRFRVIASNNDGLWNEHGAAIDIVILPAWYQTNAFLMLSVITAAMGIWAIYQLRMRQMARALNVRFDERLEERTRVARDLHDTLLQTVQGSKMVVDNALYRPDDGGMRQAMEQVSVWLGQASAEGRAAVNALRASTLEKNDLAEAFGRALEDCGRQGSCRASFSVTGAAREMHPMVRDEVYRIGYEAIRNACTHSGGNRLEVVLTYARDLILRISDNGVGIDPAVASGGKEGHFGLQGMRERAGRIGATLTVESSAGSGTEIRLHVPGRVVFHEPAVSLFARLARLRW